MASTRTIWRPCCRPPATRPSRSAGITWSGCSPATAPGAERTAEFQWRSGADSAITAAAVNMGGRVVLGLTAPRPLHAQASPRPVAAEAGLGTASESHATGRRRRGTWWWRILEHASRCGAGRRGRRSILRRRWNGGSTARRPRSTKTARCRLRWPWRSTAPGSGWPRPTTPATSGGSCPRPAPWRKLRRPVHARAAGGPGLRWRRQVAAAVRAADVPSALLVRPRVSRPTAAR